MVDVGASVSLVRGQSRRCKMLDELMTLLGRQTHCC